MDLKKLQSSLGYFFVNEQNLIVALTHSSWVNENGGSFGHNERLEFLGDAVLELCISEELFIRYPEAREGELTQMRSNLVNTKMLCKLAHDIRLYDYIFLARGEEIQGGRQREALLADAMEAVFGSIFVDNGYAKVRAVIYSLYTPYWTNIDGYSKEKDYKTRLQEETQKRENGLPRYILKKTYGPEHEKTFVVCLELPNGSFFEGKGMGLKKAEQEAARIALESLGVNMQSKGTG